jgi:uncharacterized membrane-anchored protein YhcB (DUF1043 family)
MNEKIVVVIFFVIGLLFIQLKVKSMLEQKRVEKMQEICKEKYNRTYSHHDEYHFWCYKPAEILQDVDLNFVQVQWSDNWQRPFEPPKYNFSLNYS